MTVSAAGPAATTRHRPAVRYTPGLRALMQFLALLLLVALFFPLGTTVGGIRVVTADVVLLPLGVLVMIVHSLAPQSVQFRLSIEDRLGAGFLVVLLLSSVLALDPVVGLDRWLVWVRAAAVLALFRWLAASGLVNRGKLVRWLEMSLGLLLFIGIVQLLTGSDFGLVANYLGQNLDQRGLFQGERRLSGTTSESNVFGQWLVMLGGLIVARALYGRHRRTWLAVLVTMLVVPLLVATLARANLLFFGFVFGYLWLRWVFRSRDALLPPRVAAAEVALVLVAGAAFLLANENSMLMYLVERFASGDATRLLQIRHGIDLLSDPKIFLFGTGMGSFYDTIALAGIGVSQVEVWHFMGTRIGIHNAFLLILTEGGVLAFLLFSAYVIAVLLRVANAASSSARHNGGYLGRYLFGMFTGFVLIPMQLYMSAIGYPTLLIAAVVLTLAYGGSPLEGPSGSTPMPRTLPDSGGQQ